MGRNRWTDRLTVEDCPICLSVVPLYRNRIFACPAYTGYTITWRLPDCAVPLARIICRLEHREPTGLALAVPLQFARADIRIEGHIIPIATTFPHLGGKRYWFQCDCGRRVGRLYLAPGEMVFRCRICHDLTYESARRHDKRVYDLAKNFARDPTAIHTAFKTDKLRRKFLAIAALTLCLKRVNRRPRRSLVYPEIPLMPYPSGTEGPQD